MDDRTVATGVAAGRLLLGLVLMLVPRLLVHRVGRGVEPPPPYVWWLRAFGIRDAVLGAGTLRALGEAEDTASARWVQAGAAADALDAASVVAFGRDLDRRSRWVTLAVAVPAALAGWRAGQGLGGER